MQARIGQYKYSFSARGIIKWEVEIWHDGLHKHRLIRGNDQEFVQRKVEVQLADWGEQWRRRTAIETRAQNASARRQEKEEQKQLASERTAEAKQMIEGLEQTLRHTLSVDDKIEWDSLKHTAPYPEPRPSGIPKPSPPKPSQIPREPLKTDPQFAVKLSLIDKLMPSRRRLREEEADNSFNTALNAWRVARTAALASDADRQKAHLESTEAIAQQNELRLRAWEKERDAFLSEQAKQNAMIDQQRATYLERSPEAITDYCDMVLANSDYPDFFPNEWELDLIAETGILIVDYALPAPSVIPTLVEVKYTVTKDEFTEKHLTESQRDKIYDSLLYQIALRSVHELYEADIINALKTVTFNGYVKAVDRRTGNEVNACVLSLQAKREEFLGINLANVEPKECFKQLKGVGSSKLHSITAVTPILTISREDPRFVSSYDVANSLDEGYNLASMDWQDFEHLIREIFGREFSSGGGEVKVTQASRDGGVDAVAFDPDPIRGGKIIIQAKRYTGTVGVSAVRDLYGTVHNEGATKGILVTTSNFGPDAYEFAKGKPLTLLNGANLLFLLEKHGHKARIDLHEAREQRQVKEV